MTERELDNATDESSPQADGMKDLLQRALAEAPEPGRSMLPAIQQKIRIRTRGRYYRDRWSTSRDPVSLILMITLLLLILCAALFLVIQPLIDSPTETDLEAPAHDPLAVDQSPPVSEPVAR